jgi:hypothetical protein
MYLAATDMTLGTRIHDLPARVARLVAIEILLAGLEALGDDTLKSGLCILREKLRAS